MNIRNDRGARTAGAAAARRPFAIDAKPLRVAGYAALGAALLCVGGCSEPPPETRLENVSDALSSSTAELETIDERIERVETELADLREARRNLRDEVRTLEQRLAARATDVALFRAAQTALLEESELQEAALAVQVDDAVLTLTGVVSSAQQERKAVAIASSVAGVATVISRVVVNDPAASGTARSTAPGN